MKSVILSIGDELVLGQSLDTNSAYLAARLVALGIGVLYHQTVADDQAAIAIAIEQAAAAADLVLITGGLGPTDDDLTRQALAQAMGVPLVLDVTSVGKIEAFFQRRGRVMPEKNRVQALHPQGSEMLDNHAGTAPGIRAKLGRATIVVVPGVPKEMMALYDHHIAPMLDGVGPQRGVILTTKVNTFGLGESDVAERLGVLMDRRRNPLVGTTVSGGVVAVRVRSEFPMLDQAQREMDDTLDQVENALGAFVYGRDEASLSQALLDLCKQQRRTLTTAESCTGGLVGAMITDTPGSSANYLGGWVAYANAFKHDQLSVPGEILERYGAVSRETALALAQGAIERSGADLALSVTGIAGPDGGTLENPVGLVWFGLAAAPHQPGGNVTAQAWAGRLGSDRETIRDRAAKTALQIARFHLLGQPIEQIVWLTK